MVTCQLTFLYSTPATAGPNITPAAIAAAKKEYACAYAPAFPKSSGRCFVKSSTHKRHVTCKRPDDEIDSDTYAILSDYSVVTLLGWELYLPKNTRRTTSTTIWSTLFLWTRLSSAKTRSRQTEAEQCDNACSIPIGKHPNKRTT